MSANPVSIVPSKDIAPEEFAALMAAVGWGDEADYWLLLTRFAIGSTVTNKL